MGKYGSRWSRDETLLAFGLYCELPFGRLHQHNPKIVELAEAIGRTPSSVVMKACNFASLDPAHQARGVKGLANASRTERTIWDAFFVDSATVVDAINQARADLRIHLDLPDEQTADERPRGDDEVATIVRVRRHQRFFRSTVLSTYACRCALTGVNVETLVVASHIIPWAASPARRCDPTNGVCLNALHDRAFDRGLITFDDNFRVVSSPALTEEAELGLLEGILPLVGHRLSIPERFQPDRDALAYHREHIFRT